MVEMKNNKNFLLLQSLPLELGEYAIFGSGIMFALGIRPLSDLHDLDIIVSKSGWEKVKGLGSPYYEPVWKCNWLKLFEEQVEVSDGWGPGEWNTENIISTSTVIGGFPFVNLENVVKWKK
jgi:hypothetical protein